MRPQAPCLCVLYTYTQGTLVSTWKRNCWHPEANLFLSAEDSATHQLWCSVLHSAASAKWQQSPSTGKNIMPRKYSSYFINSFEQTCLSFSTYLLVLPSPLLCMSSTAWKVCQIWGILIHFFPTLWYLEKIIPLSFLIYYISLVNCRKTYCNLENFIIIIIDSFLNVLCSGHSLDWNKVSTKELQWSRKCSSTHMRARFSSLL